MKRRALKILFVLLILVAGDNTKMWANEPAPGCVDGVGDDCPVPLDGGVSLLLVAGAVYGVKKLRENKTDLS